MPCNVFREEGCRIQLQCSTRIRYLLAARAVAAAVARALTRATAREDEVVRADKRGVLSALACRLAALHCLLDLAFGADDDDRDRRVRDRKARDTAHTGCAKRLAPVLEARALALCADNEGCSQ